MPPGPVVPLLTAFVVDARPLLMGAALGACHRWTMFLLLSGRGFLCSSRPGYQVSFEGVRLHGDNMLIDQGQVVIARYVPHRPSPAGLPHDADDSDSDSSGGEDDEESHRSDDDMPDAAGDGDTSSGTESPARSRTPPRRQHARHAISAGDLPCVPFVRCANEVVRVAVLCEEAEIPSDLSLPLHCGQGLAVHISKLPPQRYLQAPILLAERPGPLWPNSIFGNWPLGHHLAQGFALCPRTVPGSFGTQDGASPPHFAATGRPTSSRQLTTASPTGEGRLHADGDADVTDRPAPMTAETNAAIYVAMTFLVFAPEYLPEVVQVRASLGQDRHAILAMVTAARSPDPKQRFPRLLPVDQQSSETYGQLIAMPVWDHSGVIVLIDCRLDNRVFAIDVPPRVRLQDILRFADLPDDAAVLVYHRDVPWPMPADVWISVCPADLFLVLPADHGFFFTLPFDRLLQDATCWASPPVYPGVFRDQVWVLADARHFLFTVRRGRRHLVWQDLATSLQCLPARLLLRPAVPTIADHMRNGAFTRALLVAVQTPPGTTYRSSRLPIVFLDQRPLLLGFSWLSVTDSILDPTALRARYQNRCPIGHVLGYVTQGSRPSPLRDPLVVHDGQVVEIRYLTHIEAQAADNPPSDGTTSPTATSSDLETDSGDSAPEDPPAPPPPSSSADAGTGGTDATHTLPDHSHQRAARGPLFLGPSGELARRTFRHWKPQVFSDSRVVKWFDRLPLHALPRGTGYLTPVLLFLACLWLFDMSAFAPVPPSQGTPGPGQLLIGTVCVAATRGPAHQFLCLVSVYQHAAATPVWPVSDPSDEVADSARPECGARPASASSRAPAPWRLVPTPCRSGLLPAGEPALALDVLFLADGPTLLEDAIRSPDNQAMMEAAILLEVLFSTPCRWPLCRFSCTSADQADTSHSSHPSSGVRPRTGSHSAAYVFSCRFTLYVRLA